MPACQRGKGLPLYDTGVTKGTHTDVCISEGGGVTLNDAYIRQGRKMMPLET